MKTPFGLFGLLGAVALTSVGCGGVSFVSRGGMLPLPTGLRERTAIRNADAYRNHLDQLVGHVLYIRRNAAGECPANETLRANVNLGSETFVRTGATPVADANPPALIYSSRVDSGGAAETSVLGNSLNISGNSIAEVIVTDITIVLLQDSDFDRATFDTFRQTPLAQTDCDRQVIRGAMLTTTTSRQYQRIDANGKASAGAVSFNGNVYSEATAFSTDYLITLTTASAVPVAAGAPTLPGQVREAPPRGRSIDLFDATTRAPRPFDAR